MKKESETKEITDIYRWSYEASRYIRFKPDRDQVYQELLSHLYDKANDYEASGMKREAAMLATIEAMGDATELGLIMRKIHKPYLGYLWRLSKVLLILSILWISIVCIKVGGFGNMVDELKPQKDYWEENREYYEMDSSYELIADISPNCEATIEAYQLSVPKALHWRLTYEYEGKQYQEEIFRFIINAKHSPFLDAPSGILDHLTAIDNLGNYYANVSEYMRVRSVVGNLSVERIFSSQFEMWIDDLSPDAEWIELHYDYQGRSFKLRIPTIEGGHYD